ncbi:MAG: VOC family protein [Candidatus Methanoperedens sp.]|nr:VOC family protein [Candidatus Methanoperedens sp.]
MANHGTIIWNELDTPDQKKCGEFYCKLIGWTKKEIDAGPMGIYTIFQQDGMDVAGMMNPTGPIDTPRWSAYIAVDNIEDCVARVESFGGKILVEPHDIPDTGRVCMISDPAGAVICLMQLISKQ